MSQYVSTCNLCLCTKLVHNLPLRKLYLLLLSDIRQETISIDFIIKLPKYISFNIMMIVIDSVSKRTYLIPIYIIVIAEVLYTQCLEVTQSFHLCCLGQRTAICYQLYQGIILPTRDQNCFFHSLITPIRWTNRVCQLKFGPIFLAFCKQETK